MANFFGKLNTQMKMAIHGKSSNTSARNEGMLKELRDFKHILEENRRDTVALDINISTNFASGKKLFIHPLPRVFDSPPGQPANPTSQQSTMGSGVNFDQIAAIQAELSGRLRNEVLAPVDEWLTQYRAAKDKHTKAETLRLDMETHQRAAASASESAGKARTKGKTADAEKYSTREASEKSSIERAAGAYTAAEADLFHHLCDLVQRGTQLHRSIIASLQITSVALMNAFNVFSTGIAAYAPPAPGQVSPAGQPMAPPTPDMNAIIQPPQQPGVPQTEGRIGALPAAPPSAEHPPPNYYPAPPTQEMNNLDVGAGGVYGQPLAPPPSSGQYSAPPTIPPGQYAAPPPASGQPLAPAPGSGQYAAPPNQYAQPPSQYPPVQ